VQKSGRQQRGCRPLLTLSSISIGRTCADDVLLFCRLVDDTIAKAVCSPQALEILLTRGAPQNGRSASVSRALQTLWDRVKDSLRASAGGPETLDFATLQYSLGMTHLRLGNAVVAKPLLESALQVQERRLGYNHSEVGKTLLNLAKVHVQLGELPAAKALLEPLLLTRVQLSAGSDTIFSANILQCLGVTYLRLGNPAGAKPYLERALKVHEGVPAGDQDQTALAETLETLGSVYLELGQMMLAQELLHRAFLVRNRLNL